MSSAPDRDPDESSCSAAQSIPHRLSRNERASRREVAGDGDDNETARGSKTWRSLRARSIATEPNRIESDRIRSDRARSQEPNRYSRRLY